MPNPRIYAYVGVVAVLCLTVWLVADSVRSQAIRAAEAAARGER